MGAVDQRTKGFFILDTLNDNEVKLTVRTSTTQAVPMVEIDRGGNAVFLVNSNGGLTCNGIQSGTCIAGTDGTVTVTFNPAFVALPIVTLSQMGVTNSPTNRISGLTTSNFVVTTQAVNVSNTWIAIGIP